MLQRPYKTLSRPYPMFCHGKSPSANRRLSRRQQLGYTDTCVGGRWKGETDLVSAFPLGGPLPLDNNSIILLYIRNGIKQW